MVTGLSPILSKDSKRFEVETEELTEKVGKEGGMGEGDWIVAEGEGREGEEEEEGRKRASENELSIALNVFLIFFLHV